MYGVEAVFVLQHVILMQPGVGTCSFSGLASRTAHMWLMGFEFTCCCYSN